MGISNAQLRDDLLRAMKEAQDSSHDLLKEIARDNQTLLRDLTERIGEVTSVLQRLFDRSSGATEPKNGNGNISNVRTLADMIARGDRLAADIRESSPTAKSSAIVLGILGLVATVLWQPMNARFDRSEDRIEKLEKATPGIVREAVSPIWDMVGNMHAEQNLDHDMQIRIEERAIEGRNRIEYLNCLQSGKKYCPFFSAEKGTGSR